MLLEAAAHADATSDISEGAPACLPQTDGGAVEGGCRLYVVPPRPPGMTDPGADAGVHVFAARHITLGFGVPDVWHQLGFDRDGYCTNPGSSPTQGCRPANGLQPVEDGAGGRDDSLATQVGSLFATLAFNETDLNSGIVAGRSTIGARVIGLGGPDDPQVVVEWFPLVHGRAVDGGAALRWDGSDTWSVDARLAYDPVNQGRALIRSNAGYTSCGMLVARLPARMPIRFANTRRTVRLTLSNTLLAGPVDSDGARLGPLDISAIWPLSDALVDMGVFGVCPPGDAGATSEWNLTSQILLGSCDSLSTGESSPVVPCDAISAAFRVEFEPIGLSPDEMSPVAPEDLCVR